MKIDHVGYAVKDIATAKKAFEKLGFKATSETHLDEGRQINLLFMENEGYVIELISPASPSAPVANLLAKVGNTPYHLCYEVESLDDEMKRLLADGYMTLQAPLAAPAMGGRRVTFLVHRDIGILELVEKEAQAK